MRRPIIASSTPEDAPAEARSVTPSSAEARRDSTSARSHSSLPQTWRRKSPRSAGFRSWTSAKTSLIRCHRSGVSSAFGERWCTEADRFSVSLMTGTHKEVLRRSGAADHQRGADQLVSGLRAGPRASQAKLGKYITFLPPVNVIAALWANRRQTQRNPSLSYAEI